MPSTSQPNVRCVLAARALNGESPTWSVAENCLYWIDSREPSLHRFHPDTGQDERWLLPASVGCAAPGGEGRVLLALRNAVGWLDCHTGALHSIAPVPYDARRFTANDGKCDPQGRFWFGPMYSPLDPAPADGPHTSPLLRFDAATRRAVAAPQDAGTPNGIAWSPDGRTMYHADTKEGTIFAFDFDKSVGTLSNRRVFAEVGKSGSGGPDGGAVDSEGCYWSAVYGAGKLIRFRPDGSVEREILLPVRNPTMPAFGGSGLRTLYVTTAQRGGGPWQKWLHPHDGGLFACDAPAPGLPCTLADPAYFAPAASGGG